MNLQDLDKLDRETKRDTVIAATGMRERLLRIGCVPFLFFQDKKHIAAIAPAGDRRLIEEALKNKK